METNEQLMNRLSDQEDRFVERKLEGVGGSEFKKQIVAFANSLPTNRTGVLFIGVTNGGPIQGVSNSDSLLRTLRQLAENECYPPVFLDLRVLPFEGKDVVAAIISGSAQRPHFTGGAFIRRGSESLRASESEFESLIVGHNDKARALQELIGTTCTGIALGKEFGKPYHMGTHFSDKRDVKVSEVTAFFARFELIGSGSYFSEILECIQISYDDEKHRPLFLFRDRSG